MLIKAIMGRPLPLDHDALALVRYPRHHFGESSPGLHDVHCFHA